jgi:hypothetical protein
VRLDKDMPEIRVSVGDYVTLKTKNVVRIATCYKTAESARLCPFLYCRYGLHSHFGRSINRFEVSLDCHVILQTVDAGFI